MGWHVARRRRRLTSSFAWTPRRRRHWSAVLCLQTLEAMVPIARPLGSAALSADVVQALAQGLQAVLQVASMQDADQASRDWLSSAPMLARILI